MGKQTERIINAERVEDLIAVFGSFDENIKRIEEALSVKVINRGTDLRVCGDEEMVDRLPGPWKAFWRLRPRAR